MRTPQAIRFAQSKAAVRPLIETHRRLFAERFPGRTQAYALHPVVARCIIQAAERHGVGPRELLERYPRGDVKAARAEAIHAAWAALEDSASPPKPLSWWGGQFLLHLSRVHQVFRAPGPQKNPPPYGPDTMIGRVTALAREGLRSTEIRDRTGIPINRVASMLAKARQCGALPDEAGRVRPRPYSNRPVARAEARA